MADARASVSIVVTSIEVVEITPGAWCPHCALPSASTIVLASLRSDGPMQLSTGVRCQDCRRWTADGS